MTSRLLLAAVAVSCAAVVSGQSQQQTFKSGVDLVRIDASVLDSSGRPVQDLGPADFIVTVDGKPRTVASAHFYGTDVTAGGAPTPPPSAPLGAFAFNLAAPRGRIVVLIVDIDSLHPGNEKTVLTAAGTLLDELRPSDAAGLMLLPGKGVELTREHDAVRQALGRIVGGAPAHMKVRNMTLVEADAFMRGNASTRTEVIERECRPSETTCPGELGVLAREMLAESARRIQMVVPSVASLIQRLESTDAPKSLVILSGGLPATFESRSDFRDLQRKAASGGATVSVVQIDQPRSDASVGAARTLSMFGPNDLTNGLNALADATDATIYHAVGRASGAFERIRAEVLTSYMIGFAAEPRDRDGKSHAIAVRVQRPGLTVRTRKEIAPVRATPAVRSPVDVLSQPIDVPEIPLIVSTYATLGESPETVKAIVLLESPAAGSALKYAFILQSDGKKVFETADAMKLSEHGANGFVAAQLAPGRYRLRAAVVDDANHAGSIETPIAIGLRHGVGIQMSDLLVGTVSSGAFTLATHIPSGVQVSTILELYATDAPMPKNATVELELRRVGENAVLQRAVATMSAASERRSVASGELQLTDATEGQYSLAAIVTHEGKAIGKVTRTFAVTRRR